jgi:hypothetical protein
MHPAQGQRQPSRPTQTPRTFRSRPNTRERDSLTLWNMQRTMKVARMFDRSPNKVAHATGIFPQTERVNVIDARLKSRYQRPVSTEPIQGKNTHPHGKNPSSRPVDNDHSALNPSRGGARPNAGRKPTGRVRLVVHLKPATRAAIQRAAERAKKTTGEFLESRFPGKRV